MNVVIDTNILISSLIHNSAKRKILFLSNLDFYYPEESKIEIEKYKDYIMQKSALNNEDYQKILKSIFSRLNLVKQEEIEKFLPEAREIMDKIDPKDSIFISCALAHNAGIWSEDNDFLMQNKVKTITQKEIIDFILDNSKKD